MSDPGMIWIDYPAANRAFCAYDEPPQTDTQHSRTPYRRADLPRPEDAERIAELEAANAALRKVEQAARALNVRELVAGWNGEGLETPYTPHAPELWAKITTTCGVVYDLDAALKGAAND
jgi:hypothetical protein